MPGARRSHETVQPSVGNDGIAGSRAEATRVGPRVTCELSGSFPSRVPWKHTALGNGLRMAFSVTVSVTIRTTADTSVRPSGGKIGGQCPEGIWIFIQMPSEAEMLEMAGSTGLEPATSGLTVQCANQAAPRARSETSLPYTTPSRHATVGCAQNVPNRLRAC